MATNKLTDKEVKLSNTRASDYKIADGGGLYLLIKNNGTKCWRLAYRFAGKQKTLAIGTYPSISLKQARITRDEAKEKLLKNIDPSLDKKQEKLKQQLAAANTFESIARDWWQHSLGHWTTNHSERVIGRLEADVFPRIGITPITELRPPHIKAIIRRIEQRSAFLILPPTNQNCAALQASFQGFALTLLKASRPLLLRLPTFHLLGD